MEVNALGQYEIGYFGTSERTIKLKELGSTLNCWYYSCNECLRKKRGIEKERQKRKERWMAERRKQGCEIWLNSLWKYEAMLSKLIAYLLILMLSTSLFDVFCLFVFF